MRPVHLHLLFLACAAWIVAELLSSVTEGALAPSPTLTAPPPARRVAAARPPLVPAPRLARLLGLPPSSLCAPDAAPKATTPSPLLLLGTLEPSFAAVFDPLDHRVHTVAPGDLVHDDEILSIAHTTISVRHDGAILELRLDQTPPKAGSPAPRLAATTSTFSHAELASLLENPQDLLKQVQLMPHFAAGRFVGFKVLRLDERSILARAGLAKGDVIRRLNGLDLTAPEAVTRLLTSASSATQVDVELDRDSQPLHWAVALTP